MYQFDGWRFRESPVQMSVYSSLGPGVVSVNPYTDSNGNSLIAVSNNKLSEAQDNWKVFTLHWKTKFPLRNFHNKVLKWCNKTRESLKDLNAPDLKSRYSSAIKLTDKSVTFDGPVVFGKNLHISETLVTAEAKDTSSGKILGSAVISKHQQLQKAVENLNRRIHNLNDLYERALRKDGSQTFDNLHFKNVTILCNRECTIGNVKTRTINGQSVNDLYRDVLFLDKKYSLPYLHFQNLVIDGSLDVRGKINGLPPKELVTKSGDHIITGEKTFHNRLVLEKGLTVGGTVDGVKISPEHLLLTYGDQYIKASMHFKSIEVNNLNVSLVNNVNLEHVFDEAVLIDAKHKITGHKVFHSDHDVALSVGGDVHIKKGPCIINSIDLLELNRSAVRLYSPLEQIITGKWEFDNLIVENSLSVEGSINGIRIPDDVILLDSNNVYHLPATITFQGDVSFDELILKKGLYYANDSSYKISVHPNGELDVWPLSKNITISGEKTFVDGILLRDHSEVTYLVNGFDLSELDPNAHLKKLIANSLEVEGQVLFNGSVSLESINGINITKLLTSAVKIHDKEFPPFKKIIVKSDIQIKDLWVGTVNQVNPSDWLLVSGDQTIVAPKVFTGSVSLQSSCSLSGYLNGRNLTEFADSAIRIYGTQEIPSAKIFEHLVVDSAKGLGRVIINGVLLDDVVLKHSTDLITGMKKIKGDVKFTDSLNVGSAVVHGLVDGENLELLVQDTLWKKSDRPQLITGKKTFTHSLNCSKIDTRGGQFGGIEWRNFWSSLVFKDVPTTIDGSIIFKSAVKIGSLNFTEKLDGVTFYDMKHNWLLQDEEQTFSGLVRFGSGLSAGNVVVKSGYIGNVSLGDLVQNTVKINQDEIFNAPVKFGTVRAEKDIQIDNFVNNLDFSKEVMTKYGDYVVSGKKEFLGGWEVMDNLEIEGILDTYEVNELCDEEAFTSSSKNLIVKGDAIFEGDTFVGLLNDYDLGVLKEELWLSNRPTHFSSVVDFKELYIDELYIKGALDGINIDKLKKEWVDINSPDIQQLSGTYTFVNDVFINSSLHVHKLQTDHGIGEIDVRKIANNLLTKHTNQNITGFKHFDTLVITGNLHTRSINGINLGDCMLHGVDNVVTGAVTFEGSVFADNVFMDPGFTIQGVDVSDWAANAVLTHGKHFLQKKTLYDPKFLNNIKVHGLVDGVKFSRDNIMTSSGNQTIYGHKVLNSSCVDYDCQVVFSNLYASILNGIDVNNFYARAVKKFEDNEITGVKHFDSLTLNSATLNGKVSGISVKDLFKEMTDVNLQPIEESSAKLIDSMASMREILNDEYILLNYYEIYQIFKEESVNGMATVDLKSYNGQTIPTLALSTNYVVKFLIWDSNTNQYGREVLTIDVNDAGAVVPININGRLLLFVPKSKKGSKESPLYLWSTEEQKFLLHQKIKTDCVVDAVVITTTDVYLFVANHGVNDAANSTLLKLNSERLSFDYYDSIQTLSAKGAASVSVDETLFLAVCNSNDSSVVRAESQLYSFKNNRLTFYQNLFTTGCNAITAVCFDKTAFIAVVEQRSVAIYRYSRNAALFTRMQVLPVPHPIDINFSVLETKQLYLQILTNYPQDNLLLYEYLYASEFVHKGSITVTGCQHIAELLLGSERHALGVSGYLTSNTKNCLYCGSQSEPTRILVPKYWGKLESVY